MKNITLSFIFILSASFSQGAEVNLFKESLKAYKMKDYEKAIAWSWRHWRSKRDPRTLKILFYSYYRQKNYLKSLKTLNFYIKKMHFEENQQVHQYQENTSKIPKKLRKLYCFKEKIYQKLQKKRLRNHYARLCRLPLKRKEVNASTAVSEEPDEEIIERGYLSTTGNLKLSSFYYSHEGNATQTSDQEQTIWQVGGEAQVRYDVRQWTFLSTLLFDEGSQDFYQSFPQNLSDDNPARNRLDLNELYALWWNGPFQTLIGKKVFTQGFSTIYSPLDILSSRDAIDPLKTRTLGQWGAQADYSVGEQTRLQFFLIPIFRANKFAPLSSRWSLIQTENSEFQVSEEEFEKKDEIQSTLLLKTTHKGWDGQLLISYGLEKNPVLTQPDPLSSEIIATFSKSLKIGAGAATVLGGWATHAELLWSKPESQLDDQYVLGLWGINKNIETLVDWFKVQNFHLTLEYVKEHRLSEGDSSTRLASSQLGRPFTNDVLLKLSSQWNNRLSFLIIGGHNFSVTSRFFQIETKYRWPMGLHISLGFDILEGDDEGYFGRWRTNDRGYLELGYQF